MKNLNTNIELTTMIKQDDDLQKHLINSTAKIQDTTDRRIITFKEINDEGEFFIRFDVLKSGEVLLNRSSTNRQNMSDFLFRNGEETSVIYKNIYGMIDLKCQTSVLSVDESELRIEYQLFEQEKLIGEYKLQLIFRV